MDSSYKLGMVHYEGLQVKNVILSLKILFFSANSVDPDEMLHVCKSTCYTKSLTDGLRIYRYTLCHSHIEMSKRTKSIRTI